MKGRALAVVIPLALAVVGVYVLLAKGMTRKPKPATPAAEPVDRQAAVYEIEGDQFEYATVRRKRQPRPPRFDAALPTAGSDHDAWRRDHTRFPPVGWFRARLCAGDASAIARYEAAAEDGVDFAELFSACPEGSAGYCEHALGKLRGAELPDAWRRPVAFCTHARFDAAFDAPGLPDVVVIERFREARRTRAMAPGPRMIAAVRNVATRESADAADAVDDLAISGDPAAIDALLELHAEASGELREVIAASLEGVADPRARRLFKAFCRREPDADECYEHEDGEAPVEEVARRRGLREAVRAQDVYDLPELVRLTPPSRREQLVEALAACAEAERSEVQGNFRLGCVAELRLLDAPRATRAAALAADMIELEGPARGLRAQARFESEPALVAHLTREELIAGGSFPDVSPRWTFPSAAELMLSAGQAVRLRRDGGEIPTAAAATSVAHLAGLPVVFDAEMIDGELELRAWDGETRWATDAEDEDLDVEAVVGFVNELLAKRAGETRCLVESDEGHTSLVVCGPRRALRAAVEDKLLGNARND